MMRTFTTCIIVTLLAFMPFVARAQPEMPPTPATPVPGEAPVGVLAQYDVDELPSPHTEVWFVRMRLAVAGSVAMGKQAGPAVIYVESGNATLVTDLPGEAAANAATPVDAARKVLAAGEPTFIDAGTPIEVRNQGASPTSFLMLLMFAAESEGMYQEPLPEPIGLRQGGVSIGTAEFPPLPAQVTIERVTLNPGQILSPDRPVEPQFPVVMRMELGAIETGSADVTLDFASSSNITWPGILRGEMAEPRMVPLSTSIEIGTGDAYAIYGSIPT